MKFKKVILGMAAVAFLTGCGGGGGSSSSASSGGGYITVDPLELGIEAGYTPVKGSIKKMSGNINVALVLDASGKVGWDALATEYSRLHGGEVTVNVLSGYTNEDKYKSDLLEQENNTSTKNPWNIVQGNLISNPANLYSMTKDFSSINSYAGDKKWTNVLDQYATSSGEGKIINSENLSTAWFVNKDALADAGKKGYVNADGKVENPKTWEDLMSLCAYMQEAGYTHPLGISLDTASVESTQFTWLVRVYGDYYYRNEYNYVIAPEIEYDPEGEPTGRTIPYVLDFKEKQPEADTARFSFCYTNFANTILNTMNNDDGVNYYVGAQSAKFKEFLTAMAKMKPYIVSDAATKTFPSLRDSFATQSAGKGSVQILLDYLGNGLEFENHDGTGGTNLLNFDYFDYPYISEGDVIEAIAEENGGEYPMVRDVGGNGGYLSILTKGVTKQNELSADFLKFVVSPYGQTVYYNAMVKTKSNPQGITTVKKVVVPTKWKTYFENNKVQFNGNVDKNEYISLFVRFMNCTNSVSAKMGGSYWTELISGNGTKAETVDKFAKEWKTAIDSDWATLCKERSWNSDAYKKEHWNDWKDQYLKHGTTPTAI